MSQVKGRSSCVLGLGELVAGCGVAHGVVGPGADTGELFEPLRAAFEVDGGEVSGELEPLLGVFREGDKSARFLVVHGQDAAHVVDIGLRGADQSSICLGDSGHQAVIGAKDEDFLQPLSRSVTHSLGRGRWHQRSRRRASSGRRGCACSLWPLAGCPVW